MDVRRLARGHAVSCRGHLPQPPRLQLRSHERVHDYGTSWGTALRDSAFTVSSVITTTGFIAVDFDQWDSAAEVVLILLMFVGGCAGSTAGSIKVIRILIIFRTILQDIFRMILPRAVTPLQISGRVVPETVRIAVLGLFAAWIGVFGIATFIVALQPNLTPSRRPRRWRRPLTTSARASPRSAPQKASR
jgi:hypothetical protein